MKKLMLAVCALVVSHAALAQTDFGIKAGLNYTKTSQIKLDGNSSDFKPGFHAGVFADINLLVVGIRPELLYSQKGFEMDSEDGKLKSTLSYIDVPVMVKFNPAPIIGLYLGPQISFLLADKWKWEDAAETFDPEKNTTEFSGVVGAGLRLGKLDLGARYNFGLSKVLKDERFENFDKSRNQVFQLSVGVVL